MSDRIDQARTSVNWGVQGIVIAAVVADRIKAASTLGAGFSDAFTILGEGRSGQRKKDWAKLLILTEELSNFEKKQKADLDALEKRWATYFEDYRSLNRHVLRLKKLIPRDLPIENQREVRHAIVQWVRGETVRDLESLLRPTTQNQKLFPFLFEGKGEDWVRQYRNLRFEELFGAVRVERKIRRLVGTLNNYMESTQPMFPTLTPFQPDSLEVPEVFPDLSQVKLPPKRSRVKKATAGETDASEESETQKPAAPARKRTTKKTGDVIAEAYDTAERRMMESALSRRSPSEFWIAEQGVPLKTREVLRVMQKNCEIALNTLTTEKELLSSKFGVWGNLTRTARVLTPFTTALTLATALGFGGHAIYGAVRNWKSGNDLKGTITDALTGENTAKKEMEALEKALAEMPLSERHVKNVERLQPFLDLVTTTLQDKTNRDAIIKELMKIQAANPNVAAVAGYSEADLLASFEDSDGLEERILQSLDPAARVWPGMRWGELLKLVALRQQKQTESIPPGAPKDRYLGAVKNLQTKFVASLYAQVINHVVRNGPESAWESDKALSVMEPEYFQPMAETMGQRMATTEVLVPNERYLNALSVFPRLPKLTGSAPKDKPGKKTRDEVSSAEPVPPVYPLRAPQANTVLRRPKVGEERSEKMTTAEGDRAAVDRILGELPESLAAKPLLGSAGELSAKKGQSSELGSLPGDKGADPAKGGSRSMGGAAPDLRAPSATLSPASAAGALNPTPDKAGTEPAPKQNQKPGSEQKGTELDLKEMGTEAAFLKAGGLIVAPTSRAPNRQPQGISDAVSVEASAPERRTSEPSPNLKPSGDGGQNLKGGAGPAKFQLLLNLARFLSAATSQTTESARPKAGAPSPENSTEIGVRSRASEAKVQEGSKGPVLETPAMAKPLSDLPKNVFAPGN